MMKILNCLIKIIIFILNPINIFFTAEESNRIKELSNTNTDLLIFISFIRIMFKVVYLVLFAYFLKFVINIPILSDDKGDWGTFGDYMGGVLNPILAFMSFMALLYTIKLQSEELKATREELARSAKAQENSEKALAEQSQIFQQQQFESTFFGLFEQINKAADKILSQIDNKIDSEKNPSNPLGKLYGEHKNDDKSYSEYKESLDKKSLDIKFDNLIKRLDTIPEFSHFKQYASLVYQTLKFIDSSNGIEDKKKYSSILRASIPFQLLQLLAINAVRDRKSFEGYKKYIEKYAFLEHMPFNYNDNLLNPKGNEILIHLVEKYDDQAFGESDYLKEIEYFKAVE